jgi:hypothetical protein
MRLQDGGALYFSALGAVDENDYTPVSVTPGKLRI